MNKRLADVMKRNGRVDVTADYCRGIEANEWPRTQPTHTVWATAGDSQMVLHVGRADDGGWWAGYENDDPIVGQIDTAPATLDEVITAVIEYHGWH